MILQPCGIVVLWYCKYCSILWDGLSMYVGINYVGMYEVKVRGAGESW